MNILLVEDELSKERSILNFLCKSTHEIDVCVKHSITSAMLELHSNHFDFILLDMSLPLYDNDDIMYNDTNEFETFGGMAVLDEIDRCHFQSRVIVITAFDTLGEGPAQISLSEISQKLREEYPDNFIGTVFYNVSSLTWNQDIIQLLTQGEKSKNENTDT